MKVFLSWAFVTAGVLSWVFALHRVLTEGALGIPGAAWILNGALAFCAAVVQRLAVRRGEEAGHLAAELKALRDRERFLESRCTGLEGQVELLSAMREVSRASRGEMRFEPVVEQVFSVVEGLIGVESLALFFPERGKGLVLAARRSEGRTVFGAAAEDAVSEVVRTAWAARRLDRRDLDLAVPLLTERAELGVLALRLQPGSPPDAAERILREVSKHLAMALQDPKLRRAALMDALTGLYTKRHLMEQAPEAVARQRSKEEPLSLLMADLDHFKRINDTLGHPAGDQVLREVSRRILEAVRESDTAYRYGGEEIVCLLPGATLPVAARVANRICRSIASEPFPIDGREPLTVTISIGVATLTSEMPTWEALLASADQSLYQAKETGRNRVVSFREKRAPA